MQRLDILLERATREYSNDEKHRQANRKNALFQQAIEQLTTYDIAPGAIEPIRELHNRNIACAAASSSRNARRILRRLELDVAFAAIVDGNNIKLAKPDPEVFRRAAELLSVEPADCIVIEDAPAGVEAAHRAGMRVIGVGDPTILGDAEKVVASLRESDAETLLNAVERAE